MYIYHCVSVSLLSAFSPPTDVCRLPCILSVSPNILRVVLRSFQRLLLPIQYYFLFHFCNAPFINSVVYRRSQAFPNQTTQNDIPQRGFQVGQQVSGMQFSDFFFCQLYSTMFYQITHGISFSSHASADPQASPTLHLGVAYVSPHTLCSLYRSSICHFRILCHKGFCLMYILPCHHTDCM